MKQYKIHTIRFASFTVINRNFSDLVKERERKTTRKTRFVKLTDHAQPFLQSGMGVGNTAVSFMEVGVHVKRFFVDFENAFILLLCVFFATICFVVQRLVGGADGTNARRGKGLVAFEGTVQTRDTSGHCFRAGGIEITH